MTKRICIGFALCLLLVGVNMTHAAGWEPAGAGSSMETVFINLWGGSTTDSVFVSAGKNIYHFDGEFWVEQPGDANDYLLDIAGPSPSELYAVGYNGVVTRYDGSAWKNMDQNATDNILYGVGGYDSTVYAVGAAGTLVEHNGTHWIQRNTGITTDLTDIVGLPSGTAYAVGKDDKLLKITKEMITPVTDPLITGLELSQIEVSPSGKLYILPFSTTRLLCYDETNWEAIQLPFTLPAANFGCQMHVESDESIYVYANDGKLMHYENGTWQETGIRVSVAKGVCKAGGTLFASSMAGELVRKNTAGIHKDSQGCPMENLEYLYAISPDDVITTGEHVPIWNFNGTSWNQTVIAGGTALGAIWGMEPDIAYIGGEYPGNSTGCLFKRVNGNWLEVLPDAPVPLDYVKAIWGTGDDNLFVIDKTRIIRKSGNTWSEVYSGTSADALTAMDGSSASDIWVSGNAAFWHSADGENWSKKTVPSIAGVKLYDVHCISGDELYAVGNNTVVHRKGNTWTTSQPDLPGNVDWVTVWAADSDNVFIASSKGHVMRKQGEGWVEMHVSAGSNLTLSGTGSTDVWLGSPSTVYHFSGTTKAETPAEQPGDLTSITIDSQAQNFHSSEWLNAHYQIGDKFVPDDDVREFTASIAPANATGVFGFRTIGKGEAVDKTNLVKLRLDGTAITYTYDANGDINSPDGTWWVQATDGSLLGPGDTMTNGTAFDVRFIIKDNGKYDLDPTDGSIHDPLVFGTGIVDTSGGGDSGGSGSSGGGCTMNSQADFAAEWLLLPLVLLALLRRRAWNK